MANIYWRKGDRTSSRHFQGAWAWGRKTIDGKERREPLGTQSPKEARQYFDRWAESLRQSTSRWAKDSTPFPDAVERFINDHMHTLKPSSQKRYLGSLLNLTPHFEGKALQDIGKADLAEFVAARRRSGVTDSTIRRDLACMSSVFTIAEDYEMVDANPVLPFLRVQRRRKRLTDADPRTRYLGHAEEVTVLSRARARYERAKARGRERTALTRLMMLYAIALAIDTGLRDEELLGLPWADVDLVRKQVTIRKERSKSGRERIVPLLERAQAILAEIPRHETCKLVLWHRKGAHFYDLNNPLKEICGIRRKLGPASLARLKSPRPEAPPPAVPDIHWHDLRRTCGCRLLQDHRMPIEQVSRWLGHASVAQTQRAYAFLKIDDLHHSVGTRHIDTTEVRRELATLPLVNAVPSTQKSARQTRARLKKS